MRPAKRSGSGTEGDPWCFLTGATLYFLGTNAHGPGYHGNLYLDEDISGYRKFRELRKVASVWLFTKMATKPIFSTPSS
ncbi:hypothetical protein KCP77_07935 [Salmonella enterica subsp. enterica]|nr:hypothetical protein KCP77_07935 [Salmonella enterica subsp. enterica]